MIWTAILKMMNLKTLCISIMLSLIFCSYGMLAQCYTEKKQRIRDCFFHIHVVLLWLLHQALDILLTFSDALIVIYNNVFITPIVLCVKNMTAVQSIVVHNSNVQLPFIHMKVVQYSFHVRLVRSLHLIFIKAVLRY